MDTTSSSASVRESLKELDSEESKDEDLGIRT